ncbi:MAG: phosphomethylpyrimidine synthase ThiC [Candidatus Omnitrophota bacterium]
MTQIEYAAANIATPLMRRIAVREGLETGVVLEGVKEGRVVILNNLKHKVKRPCGIGHGLSTKINANIGTSTDKQSLHKELKKLCIAVKYGADTVMDLSVGEDIALIRRKILAHSPIPVGTVPVYEIAVRAKKERGDLLKFDINDILDVLESQAKDGVDFFTIHAGVTRKSIGCLKHKGRVLGIVSRGGAILSRWIACHKKENPFYEYFDRILDIAYRYDITLSLGDGLRPGSILDANDQAQISELKILGALAKQARKHKVQVIIEGPGHVPMNKIKENVVLEKRICHGAPFYVLGPLVTDVAAGYDHINASIGGAIAASEGADFLCYVTPAEHLRHPSLEDVREGVIASRISAHAADIVKRRKKSIGWDAAMSDARRTRDWKKQVDLGIDKDKARDYRGSSRPRLSDVCTMCGEYCSIKMNEKNMRA